MSKTTTNASPAPGRLDFADYVAARRGDLLGSAYRITRDHHSAEDLLQTALISVLPSWERIRDHRTADAYIRRAMSNHHAGWFRRGWRRREEPADSPPEYRERWPVDAASAALEQRELWALVAALPRGQRAVIALRFYEELSVTETAQVLGCSTGTVKTHTSRAVARLRRLLATDSPTLPSIG